MSFWIVGDAGPYKEKSNLLMRSRLSPLVFLFDVKFRLNKEERGKNPFLYYFFVNQVLANCFP